MAYPLRRIIVLMTVVATLAAAYAASVATAATEAAAEGSAVVDPPKRILTGRAPTVAWLREHLAEKQDLPFEGFVFRLGDGPSFMLGDRRWRPNDVSLDALPGVPWGKYERFAELQVAGGWTFDWKQRRSWRRTIANAELLSRALAASGASGVFFEPSFRFEQEGFRSPWDYDRKEMRVRWSEAQTLVRRRGAQLMQALQSASPDLVFLSSYLTSVPAASSDGTRIRRRDESPLLASFVEGLLTTAGPGVSFVDGADRGVLEDTRSYAAAHRLVDVVGRDVTHPSLRARYAEKVEAGAGIHFDTLIGIDGPYRFDDAYRTKWLRHSAYHATLSAHRYLWVNAKDADIWTRDNVPQGAVYAVRSAYEAAAEGKALGYDLVKHPAADPLAPGAFVDDPAITISATDAALVASAPEGVDSVEFVVEGMVRETKADAPFELHLSSLPDGTHRVFARAITKDGSHTSSNVVSATRKPGEPAPAPPPSLAPSPSPSPSPTKAPPPSPSPSPSPSPGPSATPAPLPDPSCTLSVGAGANLQKALSGAPIGATVCLSGTHTLTGQLRPREGQTIVGPANLRPASGSSFLDGVALKSGSGSGIRNVTLVDLDISGFSRHGVGCWIGTTIIGGRIHHNGKDGVGCDLEGRGPVTVDGVELDHNGTDPAWYGNAGGIKWFHSHGVTIRNSWVHDNTGTGVWCDAQCGDFTVVDNVIENNERKGVFYEKGGASDMGGIFYEGFLTVTGNTIRRNNLEGVKQANAGVSIYAAKNVLVANNVFGQHRDRAVIVRNDPDRVRDDKHGWVVSNVTIRNNVLNGDIIIGCDIAACSNNG